MRRLSATAWRSRSARLPSAEVLRGRSERLSSAASLRVRCRRSSSDASLRTQAGLLSSGISLRTRSERFSLSASRRRLSSGIRFARSADAAASILRSRRTGWETCSSSLVRRAGGVSRFSSRSRRTGLVSSVSWVRRALRRPSSIRSADGRRLSSAAMRSFSLRAAGLAGVISPSSLLSRPVPRFTRASAAGRAFGDDGRRLDLCLPPAACASSLHSFRLSRRLITIKNKITHATPRTASMTKRIL